MQPLNWLYYFHICFMQQSRTVRTHLDRRAARCYRTASDEFGKFMSHKRHMWLVGHSFGPLYPPLSSTRTRVDILIHSLNISLISMSKNCEYKRPRCLRDRLGISLLVNSKVHLATPRCTSTYPLSIGAKCETGWRVRGCAIARSRTTQRPVLFHPTRQRSNK